MQSLYKKKNRSCPLCGSEKISRHYRIIKYSLKFDTSRCSTCGFIFMNPQFKSRIIDDFYVKNYYSGSADYSYIDERKIEKYSAFVWNARIKKIRKYADNGNFLDIGCSFGGLLKSASKYFTPYGIEKSDYSAKYAKKIFGKKIHCGTISDHPFMGKKFSVITMIELIEHLDDPEETIKKCFSMLDIGGLLVIQTANMDGRQARNLKDKYEYYMPGHISYFSKKNLTMALKKAGFSKIKVFQPVEFGLLPKLLKSRHSFTKAADYLSWLKIAKYHFLSKIHLGNFALTSSMVIYSFKETK